MKLIYLIVLIIRIIYLIRSRPINFIALILIQSIIICIIAWASIKTRWFSYILFLIFLGGLIVLFIYITRLASNEKLTININAIKNKTFITIRSFIFVFLFIINSQSQIKESLSYFKTFNSMYSNTVWIPTLFLILYLLLTLIVAVKISNKFEGPIKNLI